MKIFFNFLILIAISSNSVAHSLNKVELESFKEFLNTIQLLSFANNREYCGYIGYDQNDEFTATEPQKGEPDSCLPQEPPEDFDILASYHTHGAFSEDADSELPSYEDMLADINEGVDGFVATPGGRIWYTDTIDGIATMVCGKNCILTDANFNGDLLYPVENSYNLAELINRDEVDN